VYSLIRTFILSLNTWTIFGSFAYFTFSSFESKVISISPLGRRLVVSTASLPILVLRSRTSSFPIRFAFSAGSWPKATTSSRARLRGTSCTRCSGAAIFAPLLTIVAYIGVCFYLAVFWTSLLSSCSPWRSSYSLLFTPSPLSSPPLPPFLAASSTILHSSCSSFNYTSCRIIVSILVIACSIRLLVAKLSGALVNASPVRSRIPSISPPIARTSSGRVAIQ
jgi:hypothetical protein